MRHQPVFQCMDAVTNDLRVRFKAKSLAASLSGVKKMWYVERVVVSDVMDIAVTTMGQFQNYW